MMGVQSDEQILTMIKSSGNPERGYRMLMNTYQRPLYNHIRRLVQSHDDADDILQNTFVKVFRNISNFEERSSLYTWIFKIASNEAYTFINKHNRYAAFLNNGESSAELESKTVPTAQINGEQIREMLSLAMESLPMKQKQVFSLRYFEEMDYRQMSEVLETSEGALKASFHHAVKKIETFIKSSNLY